MCLGLAIIPLLILIGLGSAQADGIIEASKRGDAFAVRHYLKKFPDNLEATDGFGFTPLDWAATRGEWEAFEILIEAGARLDHVGFDGGTVLHRASHHDRPDMVRLLLDRGTPPRPRNGPRPPKSVG
jgi:ankyrin repeat protein